MHGVPCSSGMHDACLIECINHGRRPATHAGAVGSTGRQAGPSPQDLTNEGAAAVLWECCLALGSGRGSDEGSVHAAGAAARDQWAQLLPFPGGKVAPHMPPGSWWSCLLGPQVVWAGWWWVSGGGWHAMTAAPRVPSDGLSCCHFQVAHMLHTCPLLLLLHQYYLLACMPLFLFCFMLCIAICAMQARPGQPNAMPSQGHLRAPWIAERLHPGTHRGSCRRLIALP